MSLLSSQLEAFQKIAELKTVHGAAVELHVTQTAVTQRIRALESRLGSTLFRRTRRGMLLTESGEALLRYCHAAMDLEKETLAMINGAGVEMEVRISITGPNSIMRSRIIPQCFPVMQQFPNLLMSFDVADTGGRDQMLRSGQCQFAIIPPENVAKEMQTKVLKPEKYVLVCGKQRQERSIADIIKHERELEFNAQDYISFNYLKKYNLFKIAKPERHFVNRTESLAMMLIQGFGYSTLTTEFAEPYVERDQLIILNQGKTYLNNLVLAWYQRSEPPRYFSKLIESIS